MQSNNYESLESTYLIDSKNKRNAIHFQISYHTCFKIKVRVLQIFTTDYKSLNLLLFCRSHYFINTSGMHAQRYTSIIIKLQLCAAFYFR